MKTSYSDYYRDHYKVSFTEADIKSWCQWFDTQWRFINQKVVLKKNMRILEIGSGFGGLYYLLQQREKYSYLGLDLDPDIVKFTNEYFKTNVFRLEAIENLKDAKKFDVVFAFEVLEHIENPSVVCNRVAQLLKPGGIFCGTTPYPFTRNIVSDATHISVLHLENWRRLFSLAGFKKVSLLPMSFAPFFWRVHRRANIRLPFFLPIKGFVSTCLIIAKK